MNLCEGYVSNKRALRTSTTQCSATDARRLNEVISGVHNSSVESGLHV